MNGVFTPVNYSKARFRNKVDLVEAQMENLTKSSDKFRYRRQQWNLHHFHGGGVGYQHVNVKDLIHSISNVDEFLDIVDIFDNVFAYSLSVA